LSVERISGARGLCRPSDKRHLFFTSYDAQACNRACQKRGSTRLGDFLRPNEQPVAARRAGATLKQLQAVISPCFLVRGLSAANRDAELMPRLAKRKAGTDDKAKGDG
jgi:hypothetical protein